MKIAASRISYTQQVALLFHMAYHLWHPLQDVRPHLLLESVLRDLRLSGAVSRSRSSSSSIFRHGLWIREEEVRLVCLRT